MEKTMNLERIFESVLREAAKPLFAKGDLVRACWASSLGNGRVIAVNRNGNEISYNVEFENDMNDERLVDEDEIEPVYTGKPFKVGDKVRTKAGLHFDGSQPEGTVKDFTTRGKNPRQLPFNPDCFWVEEDNGKGYWSGPDTVDHI